MVRRLRSLVAVFVLALAPLTGCIAGLSAEEGDCHSTFLTTASWVDSQAVREIRSLTESEPHGPLMDDHQALDGFNLSENPWGASEESGQMIVQEVEWDVRNQTGGPALEGMSVFNVQFDGRVSVHLSEETTDGEAERLFEEFLSRLSDVDQETLDERSDRFVDSREDDFGPKDRFSSFRVQIDGPFDLSHILEDLSEQPLAATDVPGLATVTQGEWSLRLKASYERVDNGRSADEYWSISGDALDRVVVELPNTGEDPEEIADRVEKVYADLGIDADPPEPASIVTSSACVPANLSDGPGSAGGDANGEP